MTEILQYNMIINRIESIVKEQLGAHDAGHDWWHLHRVRNTALHIAKEEKADLFIVEVSALLHDISDAKFNGGIEDEGGEKARKILEQFEIELNSVQLIADIIDSVSFKGGYNTDRISCPELFAVQDADRLDAMGAIGIARCFSYGGHKNRPMYDPGAALQEIETIGQYRTGNRHSIAHFYDKLLKLKDMMRTKTGKSLAEERHQFVEKYLNQFYAEWEGKL